MISDSLRYRKIKKTKRSDEYLGIPAHEVCRYIEILFTEGMSWSNHGDWHFDHIIPVSSVQTLPHDSEQFIRVFHFTNLQPIWKRQNLVKNDRQIPELIDESNRRYRIWNETHDLDFLISQLKNQTNLDQQPVF